MKAESLTILEGDTRETLPMLAPRSIHCAVTSPPYWNLRSYLPADSPLKHHELGSERTPAEYAENLCGVFDHVGNALRDDGTLWVNLGDTYSAQPGQRKATDKYGPKQQTNVGSFTDSVSVDGIEAGSRVLIPERFALAMIDRGWLLRDVLIWHKLSPMPSSVNGWRWERHRVKVNGTSAPNKGGVRGVKIESGWKPDTHPETRKRAEYIDCPGCDQCRANDGLILRRGSWRTTSAHEYIFMFAKSMSYFCDAEAVAEEACSATIERNGYSRVNDDTDEQFAVKHDHEFVGTTRNPRSVRQFKASFYKGAHYAAFPIALPEWCIRAATSMKGVCSECGAPWCRITNTKPMVIDRSGRADDSGIRTMASGTMVEPPETTTLGWRATCTCDAGDPVPSSVLDPFGGTGTTAEAAIKLGRRAVLCELNPDYVKQIRDRIGASVPLLV